MDILKENVLFFLYFMKVVLRVREVGVVFVQFFAVEKSLCVKVETKNNCFIFVCIQKLAVFLQNSAKSGESGRGFCAITYSFHVEKFLFTPRKEKRENTCIIPTFKNFLY